MIDPIGKEREDLRMGILASTIVNIAINLFGGKNEKKVNPQDFMPQWGGGKKKGEQSQQNMMSVLMGMATKKKKKK